MLDAVPGAVSRWQHGAGHGYWGSNQPGLLLRCAGEQVVSRGVADEQPQPAGHADGHTTDGGSGDEQGHRGLHAARLPWGGASLRYAELRAFSLTGFAERTARQSGNFDHHRHHQWWLQQRDRSVGIGDAFGHDGELQSQPDSRSRFGELDHDRHGRRQYADGHLSHHGDGQWRGDPADDHGHADGDSATTAELHAFGFAGFAERSARQSGSFDHYRHHRRRVQQRDQSVGLGDAFGDDGELQSQPDSGAGLGQLDHDDYGGVEHADGNLSHHGDGQWRRHSAKYHGHAKRYLVVHVAAGI